jgi:hypothetical protein
MTPPSRIATRWAHANLPLAALTFTSDGDGIERIGQQLAFPTPGCRLRCAA